MRATRTHLTRRSWNARSRHPAIAARRLDEHLPVVEPEESCAVGADPSRIPEHCVDVRPRRVVVVKRKPQISWCTRGVQVVRRTEDRVVRVLHVSAEPVAPPRRRHELHRSLSAGRTRATQLSELRLDEVDRGENVPRNAEPALCIAVVIEQLGGRPGWTDLDRAIANRWRQAVQLAVRRQEIVCDSPELARQSVERRARESACLLRGADRSAARTERGVRRPRAERSTSGASG